MKNNNKINENQINSCTNNEPEEEKKEVKEEEKDVVCDLQGSI